MGKLSVGVSLYGWPGGRGWVNPAEPQAGQVVRCGVAREGACETGLHTEAGAHRTAVRGQQGSAERISEGTGQFNP